MVGMQTEMAPGQYLIGDDVLNGVIIMILFTCIISTLVTEAAAQQIIIRDKDMASEADAQTDDERMLIPVKYPEYAPELINLAILMRRACQQRCLSTYRSSGRHYWWDPCCRWCLHHLSSSRLWQSWRYSH